MAKIRFETGQVVNFDGNPTEADIEEVAQSLGISQSRPEPMFKSEAEGRMATAKAEGERNRLATRAEGINPYIDALVKTSFAPAATSFANTAAAGIPEIVAQRQGGNFVSREKGLAPDIARAVGMLGGMVVGAPGMAARAAGTALKSAPMALRMAGEGAAAGASMLPSPEQAKTLPEAAGRIGMQAGAGGAAGGVLGLIGMGAKPVIKGFQEYSKYKGRLSDIAKQEGSDIVNPATIIRKATGNTSARIRPLEDAIDDEKVTFSELKDSLDKEIKNIPRAKKEQLRITSLKQADEKRELINAQKSHVEELKGVLRKDTSSIVKHLKEVLPERIKDINKKFGAEVDRLASEIDANGSGITTQEQHAILEATKDEAERIGINSGRMKTYLDQWHGKLSRKISGEDVPTGMIDSSGKPLVTRIEGKGQETIPLRDFLFDSRDFRRMLSEEQIAGARGLNDEQIVGAIFNKNTSRFLADKVEGYGKLSESYAPVMNAMKSARRVFKPGMEYSDEQGIKLLENYALGKTTPGKGELIEDIQRSSDFGQGLGDITSGIKSLGGKIQRAKSSISELNANLQKKFSKEIADIESAYLSKTDKLRSQLESAGKQSKMKQDSIADQIEEIRLHHASKIDEIRDIADEINRLKAKGKILGAGLATTGVLGTAFGQRLYRGGRQTAELMGMGAGY